MKINVIHAWLVALGVAAAPAGLALAQTAPPEAAPVGLELSQASVGLPEASVRDAVSRELGVRVVPAAEAPAQRRLTVAVDAQGMMHMTFREADGQEVVRVIAAPPDPGARLATITLLAGNLARNQVDELLAPPPVVAVTPVSAVTAPAPTAAPTEDWRAARERRRVSLGVDVYLGTLTVRGATGNQGSLAVLTMTGLSVGYAVRHDLVVGADNLLAHSGASADGTPRLVLTGGPYVEGRWLLTPWLQPYVRAGIPLQWRVGGGYGGAAGVAPYAGAGVRFRIGPAFSIGVGLRAHVVVSDGYQVLDGLLPRGAVTVVGGLELAYHL